MKKLHIYLSLIAVAVTALCFSFCKKVESVERLFNATILYTGLRAADGCDWLVRIDSTKEYSPVNLDTAYMHNGLKVNMSYRLLSSKYPCGSIAGGGIQQIQITSISKK